MRSVRVVNETNGETLAAHAAVAESFWARFVGLQGRHELPSGSGLVLLPTSSIHTFFMRLPIDAVFVAEDGRVVRVGRRLLPWRIGPIASGALYCIELPANAANATQPGHIITLQPV
ncbi:MAG: DUF192 domain-containing protein [Ktedonobacterales bacterium]